MTLFLFFLATKRFYETVMIKESEGLSGCLEIYICDLGHFYHDLRGDHYFSKIDTIPMFNINQATTNFNNSGILSSNYFVV